MTGRRQSRGMAFSARLVLHRFEFVMFMHSVALGVLLTVLNKDIIMIV